MTPATEKAAPILAEDAVNTVAGILALNYGREYVTGRDLEVAEEVVQALADREASPSLPDSREEKIREDEQAIPLREAFMAGRASARCGVNRGYSELAWQDYRERLTRPVSRAVDDVVAERQRQIEAEGWTPEHDKAHTQSELSKAATCYVAAAFFDPGKKAFVPKAWPWEARWWKPADTRRMLVKAAALIIAEIERMDRARLRGDAS